MPNKKKIDGELWEVRGSNHKYAQLDDIDELERLCLKDCPADVARAKGVPYNSLRDRLVRYLSEDRLQALAWKRKRHKNKVK